MDATERSSLVRHYDGSTPIDYKRLAADLARANGATSWPYVSEARAGSRVIGLLLIALPLCLLYLAVGVFVGWLVWGRG